jgi:hypothetical protein
MSTCYKRRDTQPSVETVGDNLGIIQAFMDHFTGPYHGHIVRGPECRKLLHLLCVQAA